MAAMFGVVSLGLFMILGLVFLTLVATSKPGDENLPPSPGLIVVLWLLSAMCSVSAAMAFAFWILEQSRTWTWIKELL